LKTKAMKTCRKTLFVLLAVCISAASWAQKQPVIELFSSYPSKLEFNTAQIEKAFHLPENAVYSIDFGNDFVFSGKITMNIKRYHNLQSIAIASPRFKNAVLYVSRQTLPDKTVQYVGRLMSPNAADGFEIRKGTNDN